jgi:DNA-binding PadR family transcriptional regulator
MLLAGFKQRNRRPVTWYRLTANGRKALDKHLRALQDMISTAAS